MAYDYSSDQAGAIEDIRDTGRVITMIKASGVAIDAAKPLHGSEPPLEVPGVYGTFVEPGSMQRLGTMSTTGPGLWLTCEQIAMVEPIEGQDFTTFTAIRDTDGSTWKIKVVNKLQPGALILLYYVGVVR